MNQKEDIKSLLHETRKVDLNACMAPQKEITNDIK